MITYAQLFTIVRPFFLSRWGDSFATNVQLMDYANMAIQDIYNLDEATFTYVKETLTFTKNWDHWYADTNHVIKKVEELFDHHARRYTPTLYLFKRDDEFHWANKTITVPGKILQEYGVNSWDVCNTDISTMDITYIRDYQWANRSENANDTVPLPQRYIPGLVKLMYDWAAPISMLAGETATTDFFSHAMNRIREVMNNDWMTNSFAIKTNR